MSVQVSTDSGTEAPRDSIADMKLEVTRLPARVTGATFESAADLEQALECAATPHGKHEQLTGKEDAEWPSWYAGSMVAEQTGEGLPS